MTGSPFLTFFQRNQKNTIAFCRETMYNKDTLYHILHGEMLEWRV